MFRSLLLAATAASTLVLAGCAMDGSASTSASTQGSGMRMGAMTPTARNAYVRMAAASDLFEIQSAQMARTRATSPAVRDFAQMLIDHHSQTTAQLMTAARASGMPPMTPRLLPMQVNMLATLRGTSSANFDRLFVTQQVPAHEMALALHSNYAQNGDTPALQAVAATAVPIVQSHLDRARAMAAGGGM
jgi:putative membrane protein